MNEKPGYLRFEQRARALAQLDPKGGLTVSENPPAAPPADEETVAGRSFDPGSHAKFEVIQSHLNRLEWNYTQAGAAIGSHASSFSTWKTQGYAPLRVALALEAHVRRLGQTPLPVLVIYEKGVPKAIKLHRPREMTLEGKTYWLVEVPR